MPLFQRISKLYKPKKLIIYSRDEYKQFHMQKKFSGKKYNFKIFLLETLEISVVCKWL